MNLSNITPRKFIESYPGNGRQVLTPHGYKRIIAVHKTIKYPKFKIIFDNGMHLECAHNHVIIKDDLTEVYAKDSLNATIVSEIGNTKVVDVIDLHTEEHMYDISIDSDDELYFSNGVLSHNSGKSVTTAIYLAHCMLFMTDVNIGICGNKGAQAREFLANTKNILIELPIWMQMGMVSWNKSSIETENKMRILTDVPSSDAFRGFTIGLLVVDECAFIPPNRWDEFSDSIFPSQSGLAWKKNIILSTMNGLNHFHSLVEGARNETNGYKLYEVNWRDVPRFRSDGSIKKPEEFMDEIIKKHGVIYFNQNYGNEAIGSSHTLISADSLKKLKYSEIEEKRDGKLNIYKYPVKGHKYIMAVDPAKDGKDAFAVQIVDTTNFEFEQVASANLQIDYLLMPEFIYEWAEYYNFPYLIIENNEGAGQSIADQMYQTYEYENLHFDNKADANTKNRTKARKGYPGFRTTSKSRTQILQTLKLFIENDKLKVNDKLTISEFFRFILVNGKFQADEGSHDDMIMSLALIFAPFCSVKNFEDMRALISGLYNDVQDDKERTDFADLLAVGSFDDGVEFNTKEYDEFSQYTFDSDIYK